MDGWTLPARRPATVELPMGRLPLISRIWFWSTEGTADLPFSTFQNLILNISDVISDTSVSKGSGIFDLLKTIRHARSSLRRLLHTYEIQFLRSLPYFLQPNFQTDSNLLSSVLHFQKLKNYLLPNQTSLR
jgi:hypothetical protein